MLGSSDSGVNRDMEHVPGSVIRRGEVAEFFRRRTQLVGFSMEMHKFTQYVAEFSDNALDAIETYHWAKARKTKTSHGEPILLPEPPSEVTYREPPPPLPLDRGHPPTAEDIARRVEQLVEPVRGLLERDEPLLIMVLQQLDKPEFLPKDTGGGGRNLQLYSFEVLDTGVGMTGRDLQQFGLYLASSKSHQLRQTRGSQGFGASSAFSDAQNTTGRPIVVATRHPAERQGYASIFFTTGKNCKEYVLQETPVSLSIPHGTYIQLYFLNLLYRRGYADEYVRQTSFLNAHVNIIFVDPYGEVHIYPRRVREFVREPSYALPHPASTSIGDFQDLLRSTTHSTIIDFLHRSFCRLGRKKAKQIIAEANKQLGGEIIDPGQHPSSLTPRQVKTLYASFIAQDYYAPPTETVVPVGAEVIQRTLREIFQAEFVEAVTRPPTSSKGMAFAVEVAAVYDPRLSSQSGTGVLYRFVNRTPKLRDNSDCAIWKAASQVNWRNYRVDVASNGLPTGPVRLFANVVGPFVHLIFKAQSKQALAEDDILMRELKLAFEDVGRRLRRHIAQAMARREKARRAGVLLRYARIVARSLANIAHGDPAVPPHKLEELPRRLEELIAQLAGIDTDTSQQTVPTLLEGTEHAEGEVTAG